MNKSRLIFITSYKFHSLAVTIGSALLDGSRNFYFSSNGSNFRYCKFLLGYIGVPNRFDSYMYCLRLLLCSYIMEHKFDIFLECDCDPEGALSADCNDLGMCECRNENIEGRRCDRCVRGNTNFPLCTGDMEMQISKTVVKHLSPNFHKKHYFCIAVTPCRFQNAIAMRSEQQVKTVKRIMVVCVIQNMVVPSVMSVQMGSSISPHAKVSILIRTLSFAV